FLTRASASMVLFGTERIITSASRSLHVFHDPLLLLYTPSAVFIGLVYGELPFIILPIYAVLQKFDRSLLEAAQDLGAGRWRTFFRVTLPLSAPGFAAGGVLVFVSLVGAFISSGLPGGAR